MRMKRRPFISSALLMGMPVSAQPSPSAATTNAKTELPNESAAKPSLRAMLDSMATTLRQLGPPTKLSKRNLEDFTVQINKFPPAEVLRPFRLTDVDDVPLLEHQLVLKAFRGDLEMLPPGTDEPLPDCLRPFSADTVSVPPGHVQELAPFASVDPHVLAPTFDEILFPFSEHKYDDRNRSAPELPGPIGSHFTEIPRTQEEILAELQAYSRMKGETCKRLKRRGLRLLETRLRQRVEAASRLRMQARLKLAHKERILSALQRETVPALRRMLLHKNRIYQGLLQRQLRHRCETLRRLRSYLE